MNLKNNASVIVAKLESSECQNIAVTAKDVLSHLTIIVFGSIIVSDRKIINPSLLYF